MQFSIKDWMCKPFFHWRLLVGFAFGLVLGLGVAFRFLWLETVPGLNGDEAWLGWKAYGAAHGGALDWRTNSGNFTNPFFLLPLVWVHHFFEPSAWVIRSVSAVSGVLTLVINFFFCRLIFGNKVAVASTVLLAVTPMAIGYSRFGWEPSQIPLFSIWVVYCALALSDSRRNILVWGIFSGLGLFCGFLVHPTMAFLAFFPLVAVISRWIRPEVSWARLGLLIVSGVLSAAILGALMYSQAPAWVRPEILTRVIELTWIDDMPRFFVAWLRNLNGINFWEHLVGSWPGASEILTPDESWTLFGWDIAYGVVFLAAVIFICVCSVKFNGKAEDCSGCYSRLGLALVVAWLLGTLLFGVMNGSQKVAVWFDRYGLWAMMPGCLIVGLGYVKAVQQLPRLALPVSWAGIVFCFINLALFWNGYFRSFSLTGGNSPWLGTRVGEEQIQSQAVEFLKKWSGSAGSNGAGSGPILLSSDWFAFWPLRYYSLRGKLFEGWEQVYAGAEAPEQLRGRNTFEERFAGADLVIVEFDGSSNWDEWKKVFPERRFFENSVVLRDLAGRPTLRIDIPVGGQR